MYFLTSSNLPRFKIRVNKTCYVLTTEHYCYSYAFLVNFNYYSITESVSGNPIYHVGSYLLEPVEHIIKKLKLGLEL
jgi:hypothetical protein